MLDYPLVDVIPLIRQHLDYNRRTRLREAQAGQAPARSGQEIIYRKAGDDWF